LERFHTQAPFARLERNVRTYVPCLAAQEGTGSKTATPDTLCNALFSIVVPVGVTDRCAAERLGDLSTVELHEQSSKQDVTADVYTLTVNGLSKFSMRVLQTRHTAYRPYQDLQSTLH